MEKPLLSTAPPTALRLRPTPITPRFPAQRSRLRLTKPKRRSRLTPVTTQPTRTTRASMSYSAAHPENAQLGLVTSASGLIINNDQTTQTDGTLSSITADRFRWKPDHARADLQSVQLPLHGDCEPRNRLPHRSRDAEHQRNRAEHRLRRRRRGHRFDGIRRRLATGARRQPGQVHGHLARWEPNTRPTGSTSTRTPQPTPR